MALLKIVHYPDEPLTRVAVPVGAEEFGDALIQFANDMLETMDHNEGVGLAAPQVGVSKRIFVLCEPEGEPMCFINPELTLSGTREYGEEGCLSLPKLYAKVPRATSLQVRALDVLGNPVELEADGFLARIIQHEYDHLDGIVFPDRLDVFTREDALKQWDTLRREAKAESSKKVS